MLALEHDWNIFSIYKFTLGTGLKGAICYHKFLSLTLTWIVPQLLEDDFYKGFFSYTFSEESVVTTPYNTF